MKLKVGDKVRLKSFDEIIALADEKRIRVYNRAYTGLHRFGDDWQSIVSDMMPYLSKCVTVRSVGKHYVGLEENKLFTWHPDWFELCENEEVL